MPRPALRAHVPTVSFQAQQPYVESVHHNEELKPASFPWDVQLNCSDSTSHRGHSASPPILGLYLEDISVWWAAYMRKMQLLSKCVITLWSGSPCPELMGTFSL